MPDTIRIVVVVFNEDATKVALIKNKFGKYQLPCKDFDPTHLLREIAMEELCTFFLETPIIGVVQTFVSPAATG